MFKNIRMYNGIEEKEVGERQVTSIILIGQIMLSKRFKSINESKLILSVGTT